MKQFDDNDMVDVIQVGYGPVSAASALMLGRQGHSVAVFERWNERYTLPRAVCIDHEIYRVIAALGLRDQLAAISHPAPPYRWFNAEWKELLSIDWSAESISGGTEVNFVHQPTLEAMFDDAARRYSKVEINLGWEVMHVHQTADYAEILTRHLATGDTRTVRGRYLIGADGANSVVRRALPSGQEDRGFEADWLVIDLLPNEGVTLDVPPAAQYCNPARPTTIVPGGVLEGRYFRRWEFMRMPGESRELLETEEMAWRLLSPWVAPHQAAIVRHKVYTFRSLMADRWRNARLLIAGDAAHVMPPFMGQGMCSGLRDVWNLAWKLDLVLCGRADASLLSTYQQERAPHASDITEMAMYLGKVICIPDPVQAAARDTAFFTGAMPPPPPFPHLGDGLLQRDASGKVTAAAGLLCPHGTVRFHGRSGRFDDLTGLGFRLILRDASLLSRLDEDSLAALANIKAKVLHLRGPTAAVSGDPRIEHSAGVDLDNKFIPFMDGLGLAAILVRPDFYLYGAADSADAIRTLVEHLSADLAAHGLAGPVTAPALLL